MTLTEQREKVERLRQRLVDGYAAWLDFGASYLDPRRPDSPVNRDATDAYCRELSRLAGMEAGAVGGGRAK